MSFNSLIPQKLHRKIEKALAVEKNCLKEQVEQLRKLNQTDAEILDAALGCVQWMHLNDEKNFVVSFQVYISCLKNTPKKETERLISS